MGCRTQYCIGGSCEPTVTTVESWVTAFGYSYNSNDPLASAYANVLAGVPSPFSGNTVWKALAEASMRCRALLFCTSSPGDAGTGQSVRQSNLLPAVASTSLGGLQLGESIAGVAAGSALGLATAGIGFAFTALLSVFAHHAAAVRAQNNALQQMVPWINEAIYKADSAVANGTADATDATSFIQQMIQTFKSNVAPLTKSCNAFCGYDEILDVIVQITPQYYAQLADSTVVNVPSVGNDPTNISPEYAPQVEKISSTSRFITSPGESIVRSTTTVPSTTVGSTSKVLEYGLFAAGALILFLLGKQVR